MHKVILSTMFVLTLFKAMLYPNCTNNSDENIRENLTVIKIIIYKQNTE